MSDRIKRLYRVEAKSASGIVMFRRDYQSRKAAEERGDRLLEGIDEPGNPRLPEDDGYYREPARSVTIQESEPIEFTAEPMLYSGKAAIR